MELSSKVRVFTFLGTSKYVKKEKVKPVEEVIDVVGDFVPVPAKQEEPKFADENFGIEFDVSTLQTDQATMQLQEQAMMMPPQLGKTVLLKQHCKILNKKISLRSRRERQPASR